MLLTKRAARLVFPAAKAPTIQTFFGVCLDFLVQLNRNYYFEKYTKVKFWIF